MTAIIEQKLRTNVLRLPANDTAIVFKSQLTRAQFHDGAQYKADGAWLSKATLDTVSADDRKRIASVVPDFLIEVKSETDRINTLKKKMIDGWMANGVQLAWLIDPQKNRVWIYRQNKPVEELTGQHIVLDGENLLPGFKLSLHEIENFNV
jgi:Uma2 family endonuclease